RAIGRGRSCDGDSDASHPANNLPAGCGNAGGCIIRQWLSLKSTRIRSGTIGASVTVAFCCARADCDPMVSISAAPPPTVGIRRSEEHTSELQSRGHLVCRLLLEKKKKKNIIKHSKIYKYIKNK